jgi:hypothetical protein
MTTTPRSNLTLHRYRRENKCLHEKLARDITLTLMLIPVGNGGVLDGCTWGEATRLRRFLKVIKIVQNP